MKQTVLSLFLLLFMFSACNQNEKVANEANGSEEVIIGRQELTQKEIEPGVLTPEVLWKMGRVGGAALSPDGSQVVYTVSWYSVDENKGNTGLYLVPVSGGEPVLLAGKEASAHSPQWTKDGEAVYFMSSKSGDSQIWKVNTDGAGIQQITNIPDGINSFSVSPDGEKLYYVRRVKMEETPAEKYPDLPNANVVIADDLMYRHWDRYHDQKYSHIFITDITGELIEDGKDIMAGEFFDSPLPPFFDDSQISWSPDGRFIAYSSKKVSRDEFARSTNSQIYLYNLETGETENLTEGMEGYDRNPVFSPDGKSITWISMEDPGYESDKARLFIMNLDTKEKKDLSEDFDQEVADVTWSANGDTLYFISGIHATYQVYSLMPETGKITQITEGKHNYNDIDLQNNIMIGTRMSMSKATEVYQINTATGKEKVITEVNAPVYANISMGNVEERWIETTDGKQMLTWVIYPPDFDSTKKYPAILYCQGGPQSAVSQFFSFRWNFQAMAAQGYVVIAPNRRGLPTFGQDWNEQISGDWGGQNILDYLSAVDALKTEPFIDEKNIGAVGASYGGYSVYYLAGKHEGRFSAFISHCGVFNFESMYAATEETFFVNHDLEGPYWANPVPSSYAFSPHKFVQNWDTPILVITGKKDFRVPYTESIQAFNAAKLRGIPARLLVFPDESHWVLKPQNAVLWHREFYTWLDKWLK